MFVKTIMILRELVERVNERIKRILYSTCNAVSQNNCTLRFLGNYRKQKNKEPAFYPLSREASEPIS